MCMRELDLIKWFNAGCDDVQGNSAPTTNMKACTVKDNRLCVCFDAKLSDNVSSSAEASTDEVVCCFPRRVFLGVLTLLLYVA